jgi:hypothetical protein
MQPFEIDINQSDSLAPPFGLADTRAPPPWSALADRLSNVSARVRVQTHALAVPALAGLLMQGLVC